MKQAARPQAIIFDLDDTILDDSGAMKLCWRDACNRAAGHIDGIGTDELRAAIDVRRDAFWSDPTRHREGRLDLRTATRKIVTAAMEDLGFPSPKLAIEIAESYRDLRAERLCVIPGATSTLELARTQGIRLGLITNGSSSGQRKKIERFGLARYFDHILIEGEFGAGKPDRRVYETTLAALAARPGTTWMAGDNLEWDVAAPQRLGIYGVWVTGAKNSLPPDSEVRPDRIVETIADLTELLV